MGAGTSKETKKNKQLMLEMGYEPDVISWAVRRENGNWRQALEYLLSLEENKVPVQSVMSYIPSTKPELKRMKSDDVVATWDQAGKGRKLPEYEEAWKRICIESNLMETCQTHAAIAKAMELAKSNPISFQKTALKAVRVAYGLKENQDPRTYCSTEVSSIYQGHVFEGLVKFHSQIEPWNRTLFHAIFKHLVDAVARKECDQSALCVQIALCNVGSRQCNSRRRFVFTAAMNSFCERIGNKEEPTSASIEDEHFQKLRKGIIAHVEDVKMKAFNTVFIYPSRAYYNAIWDQTMAGDVNVHGGSFYTALLLATLGIRLQRLPYLHDGDDSRGLLGVAAFLDAGGTFVNKFIKERCWDNENFGRELTLFGKIKNRVPRNAFIFTNGSYNKVFQRANDCINPDPKYKAKRTKVAEYLKQFCYYFSEKVFIPRLVNHIIQDASLNKSADIVLSKMKGTEMKLRDFVWEEDDDCEYTFNIQNAKIFLQHMKIVKAQKT